MARKYKARKLRSPKDRFDEKWMAEPTSGCWLWLAGTREGNYGTFFFEGKDYLAPRFPANLYKGFNLSSELYVLHKCDNPACVNPDHLFIGTQKDNVADCMQKGRRSRKFGQDNPNIKLTINDVKKIKTLIGKQSDAAIAKQFNVSVGAIQHIKHGRSWGYID